LEKKRIKLISENMAYLQFRIMTFRRSVPKIMMRFSFQAAGHQHRSRSTAQQRQSRPPGHNPQRLSSPSGGLCPPFSAALAAWLSSCTSQPTKQSTEPTWGQLAALGTLDARTVLLLAALFFAAAAPVLAALGLARQRRRPRSDLHREALRQAAAGRGAVMRDRELRSGCSDRSGTGKRCASLRQQGRKHGTHLPWQRRAEVHARPLHCQEAGAHPQTSKPRQMSALATTAPARTTLQVECLQQYTPSRT